MRIVNDKIEIERGETPTYDVCVIDKLGTPYMVLENIENPVVEFIVRPSTYIREDEYVFRVYLPFFHIHKFKTKELKEYTGLVWTNSYTPLPNDKDKLFFRKIDKNKAEYRYYDENAENDGTDDYKWVPYEFRITFPFPYSATSQMDSKTYKYQVVLFGGSLKNKYETGEIPINITFKEPLLEPEDFKVGGTLSE